MVNLLLKQEWLAMLRATRAATAKKPDPQDSELGNKAYDEEKQNDGHDRTIHHAEDTPSDDAEIEMPARSAEEGISTSTVGDSPAKSGDAIKTVWKIVTNKATFLATQAKDAMIDAVEKVKQLGFTGTAKAISAWIKLDPWETALIAVPLIALICTAIALSATGFGPAGIVAGSTAAIIHAGIGNVVAGSIFATCTSAMMGGYGALVVFGGVWLGSTVFIAGLATAWKRWKSQSQRAVVLSGSSPSQTGAEEARQVVSDAMFWAMCAAAYVVYQYKSWHQGRAEGNPPVRKLKSD